jgi:O-antigen/teichoic acid export membrane protein
MVSEGLLIVAGQALRALLALLAVAAAGVSAILLGYPPVATGLTVAIATAAALEFLAGGLRAALRANETMVSEGLLIVAGQALRASLAGLALLSGLALAGFGAGVVLAAAGGFALSLVAVARRHGLPRPRLDLPLWWATARETAPVTLWLVMTQIGTRSDAIIIGQWWPTAEVGRFHAASGLLGALNVVVGMALAALYPRLVRLRAAGDEARGARLAATMLGGGLALALTVTLLAPLLIDQLLLLLLGDRFAGAGPPLDILRWALPTFVLSGLAGVLLRSRGEDRPLAAVAVAGAVVSLALNLLLIPGGGAIGAAASTLVAELTMAALATVLLWRRGLPILRPIAAGLTVGGLAGGGGLAAAALAPPVWWLVAGVAILVAGAVLLLAAGLALVLERRGRLAVLTGQRPLSAP